MTSTASVKTMFLGLFGTVNATTTTLTKGVGIVAGSMDIADRFVKDANKRSIADSEATMKSYSKRAVVNAKKEDARFFAELDEELASNPRMAAHYEALDYSDVESKIDDAFSKL